MKRRFEDSALRSGSCIAAYLCRYTASILGDDILKDYLLTSKLNIVLAVVLGGKARLLAS
jgi:hypothetical protein